MSFYVTYIFRLLGYFNFLTPAHLFTMFRCMPERFPPLRVSPAGDIYARPPTAATLRRLHLEISKTDGIF